MVLSAEQLEAALVDGTYQVYSANPEATTVNKVRKYIENAQSLEQDFFLSEDWKQKSKLIIKETVEKLMEGWVPDTANNSAKSKDDAKPSISDADEPSDGEFGAPSPKRRKQDGKSTIGKKNRASHAKVASKVSSKAAQVKRKRTQKVLDSEESGGEESKSLPSPETNHSGDNVTISPGMVNTAEATMKEEEEYSDVIDEPQKPKRRRKESRSESAKPSKPAQKKKATQSDDLHEAEIKKLQSQLLKCGIRKLWHNELKKYGEDARAKLQHLKKMLADVGMHGRFSEAKAREIKETRELLADAEAAQEMNSLWGMDSGARASRSKTTANMKLDDIDDSDGEPEDARGDTHAESDDDSADSSFAARRRRAQAELAFLGDDSESD